MDNCKTIREYENKIKKTHDLPPTKLIRCPSSIDVNLDALKRKNDKILKLFETISKFY